MNDSDASRCRRSKAPPTGTHIPLIERYRERLPFAPGDPLVSLQEGSTPLVARAACSPSWSARACA